MTKILLGLPRQGQSSGANIYHSGQLVSMASLCDIPTADSVLSTIKTPVIYPSLKTRIALSVHVLGGMIPQRVMDADALLQSSKCFVCSRLHFDSHEKLHSRPKSSDVIR